MPPRDAKRTAVAAPPDAALPLARPVEFVPKGSLSALRKAASGCRACPLWRPATQTVFGRGPARARAMLVGEQPGAQEDLAGLPFVGPSGLLLERAIEEAGLSRRELYLTNAVKHFKFEARGKVRLHKRANASEQAACRPWLAGEMARLHPPFLLCLGAMAAQAVLGAQFRLTRERGRWFEVGEDQQALATWHPSAILRAKEDDRRRAYAQLVGDLRMLAAALAGGG